jgi:signal transducing adaptor molecule
VSQTSWINGRSVCIRFQTSLTRHVPNSAKDAVAALIKRLAHRNANVQLYTLEVRLENGYKSIRPFSNINIYAFLESDLFLPIVNLSFPLQLANALAQNCGTKIHRELASRSFTDALLRLAADRVSHVLKMTTL